MEELESGEDVDGVRGREGIRDVNGVRGGGRREGGAQHRWKDRQAGMDRHGRDGRSSVGVGLLAIAAPS